MNLYENVYVSYRPNTFTYLSLPVNEGTNEREAFPFQMTKSFTLRKSGFQTKIKTSKIKSWERWYLAGENTVCGFKETMQKRRNIPGRFHDSTPAQSEQKLTDTTSNMHSTLICYY